MYPELANLDGAAQPEIAPATSRWSAAGPCQPATSGAGPCQPATSGPPQRPCRHEQGRVADEERMRVAREIHDLVGHGLAVINVQAATALHIIGQRPDQAGIALEAIKATSRDALQELRGILAALRQPEAVTGSGRPAAGLDRLGALIEELGGSGLAVKLEVQGRRRALPGAVDLAAYRIVQESLTNVLRHAGQASATVRVGYQPAAVALEILDGGGRPGGGHPGAGRQGDRHAHAVAALGGGHGISGMRERAAALGGTLEAGPRRGGGFRVLALLPAGVTTQGRPCS